MNLSKLVGYKNLLESWKPHDPESIVNQKLGPSLSVVGDQDVVSTPLNNELLQNYHQVQTAIENFNSTYENIIKEVQTQIESLQPQYFNRSYQLYDKEMRNDSAQHILERRLSPSDSATQYLTARISPHSNWQHSGMILRPGKEEWIDLLVGLDPLYLIDQSYDLFQDVKQKFNDSYQFRLRYGLVDEYNDDMLCSVPDSQIGFCLAYYFFNFKPFELVKKYLENIYKKLKPGGVLMMTINDCSRPGGVKLAEQNFMCYTPGDLVKSLAMTIGFEIYHVYEIDAACSWIELKKPGKLSTLRGGQSLAKIIEKSK